MSEIEEVTKEIIERNNMDEEAIRRVVSSIFDQIEKHFPFRECAKCETFLENTDTCPSCGHEEDKPAFREHQKEITIDAAVALYIEGYDNVAIEGPTGIGKSAINYTLGMMSGDAFYTTPQKSLRNQLANDEALQNGMHALRGRRDYTCGETGKNCSDCPVNTRNDKSCKDMPACTYWNNKMKSIGSPIAALTFAYLIVDKYLPPMAEDGSPISFTNRDLLIVDEGHTLENQVASLFAGFKVSPWSVPVDVYGNTGNKIKRRARRGDIKKYEQVRGEVSSVADRARRFVEVHSDDEREETQKKVEKCESFLQKFKYMKEEISEGRHWVVDIEDVNHPDHNGKTKTINLKPVKVDRFLQKFVWSRSDKVILSTATMPYRQNPQEWFDRLGLEGKTKVIRKPMPFPKENRLIHTGTIIDKFSGGGDDENWNKIVDKVYELAEKHDGEKGLIHTASYARAEKLVDSLPSGMAMVDERGVDSDEMVEKWQNSNKQILCSPSMTEGVDLKYDKCRWQVMLKIPYPNSHHDSRVAYMLNELKDWNWYYTTTGLEVIQSIGRAVRAKDDEANYYVLDESFKDIISKTNPPKWVVEALVD